MSNLKYNPLPRAELFAQLPPGLPAKEVLTDIKGGPLVMMYQRLFRKFRIQPRGVIHLGGNIGQEALAYLMLGYEKVVFVEPEPSVFQQLQTHVNFVDQLAQVIDNFVDEPRRRWGQAIQAAAGDQEGTAKLFVQPDHSQANSILKPIPGSMSDILKPHAQEISVPMRTVDFLINNLEDGWQPSDFNILYVNVEGAELLALKGAVATLKGIDFAFVEVNLKQHYEGDPTADELERFMQSQGFDLSWSCGGLVPDTGYLVFTSPGREK